MRFSQNLESKLIKKNLALLVAQTVKNPPAMQETKVQSLGWEEPLEMNGNPLQYSCPENLMDRGPWWTVVHEVTKSRPRLNDQSLADMFQLKLSTRIRKKSLVNLLVVLRAQE